MSIEDAHVCFTLLRSRASACKVNYLLRVVPSFLIAEASRKYDAMTASVVEK